MITKDQYCIQVCKAKCCYHPKYQIKCSKLTMDCKCSIYEQRFGEGSKEEQVVDFYQIKNKAKDSIDILPFTCSRISKLIETKQLAPHVEDQCCYAHPELLEKYSLPKGIYYETCY